jgi:hypothetical protein
LYVFAKKTVQNGDISEQTQPVDVWMLKMMPISEQTQPLFEV